MEPQSCPTNPLSTTPEDEPRNTNFKSMDKINTATKDDQNDSDDHTLSPTEDVKRATETARRSLYLHHRHDKRIHKQFTPSNITKHMKLPHHIAHQARTAEDPEAQTEVESSSQPTTFTQNIRIMLTTFPYWNMAFWSGWCYSIGSALFIIDGAWSFSIAAFPESEFHGEETYGVPLLFFFGACLYQVGGVMAYLEAVNDGSFAGSALKRVLEGHQDLEKQLLDAKLHTFFGHMVPHHHHEDEDHQSSEGENNWKSLSRGETNPDEVYNEAKEKVDRRGGVDQGPSKKGEVRQYMTWRWWPTWNGLITYHIFELGYVACTIQLFGVTLYGVTSIVILPGILTSLQWWQKIAAYWVPQVVASCCFLIASVMFTVMAQDKWWKPKPRTVSWWIGIWAQAGSVGFLLCAVFGFYSHEHTWGEYQSSLSSTWGSFFYMMSGLFQWYEAINVNVGPVLAFPNNRTPVLLRRSPS